MTNITKCIWTKKDPDSCYKTSCGVQTAVISIVGQPNEPLKCPDCHKLIEGVGIPEYKAGG